MDSANPQHLDVVPSATLVGVSQDQCQVTLAVTFPADIVSMYGAPAAAAVRVQLAVPHVPTSCCGAAVVVELLHHIGLYRLLPR